MLRIFCFYILLLIFFPNAAFSAVANTNADSGTACSSSSPMMTADGSCRATPSKYEAQIYEMGLCTSDPFDNGNNTTFDSSTCTVVYSDASPSAVDLAATLGSGLTLPGTSSRPANGTYKYPYIILSNQFTVNGSFTSNGTAYYSTGSGNASSTGTQAEYTDTLANFGGPNCVSGYLNATVNSGTISGFITNSSLTRSDSSEASLVSGSYLCDNRTRLVGTMNLTTPVKVTSETTVFQFNFELTNFGIQFFDESGSDSVPDGFGSGPFSGYFFIE